MDRGFYSAENLQYLIENGHRFIIALPQRLAYTKELILKGLTHTDVKRYRAKSLSHLYH